MKLNRFSIIFLCALSLLMFIFWNNYLQIGGDDSKIYYFFSEEYIQHFASKIISDNQPGSLGLYFSQTYVIPLVILFGLFQKISSHSQMFFFILNVLAATIFFSEFLKLLLQSIKVQHNQILSLVLGFFYASSVFNYFTIWNHQLFALYLLSYVILGLFLLFRTVIHTDVISYLFLCLSLFVFSTLFYSIPWIAATVIVIFPYLLYLLKFKNKYLFFYLSFLAICFVLLNAHWLVHMLIAFTSNSLGADVIGQASSADFAASSVHNITAVSKNNSLIYPISFVFHKQIQIDFGWKTLDVFSNLYEKNMFVNCIFLLIICFSFVLNKSKQEKQLLVTALSSWLLGLYFFTVNLGNWGFPLFLQLNKIVPGFSMFRNMYDKFALGLALSSTLLIAISSTLIFQKIKNKNRKQFFLFVICALVFINSLAFIRGDLIKLPYGTTTEIYNRLTNTKEQISAFVSPFLQNDFEGKVVWMPLNTSNYVIIKDTHVANQYYAGVSPVSELTQVRDFGGFISFNANQQSQISSLLDEKDYVGLGKLFQSLNINYIASYTFNDSNITESYLFSLKKPGDLFKLQRDPELIREIYGKKLFENERYYSLFEINPKYHSEKIYLTDSYDEIPTENTNLSYSKISSHQYSIKIKNLESIKKLVFLDPYHEKWQLRLASNDKKPILAGAHDFVLNYANGWQIDPHVVGSSPELYLYFQPFDYYWSMIYVSCGTFAILLMVFIFVIVKKYKQ